MIHQSCAVMQKTDSRKDRVSFYRFRRNEQVTGKGLTEIAISPCIEQCRDTGHLLLIEDSSEFNLERHRGRITDRSGLELTGNNRAPGFFCHPAIAVNAHNGSERSIFTCGTVLKIRRASSSGDTSDYRSKRKNRTAGRSVRQFRLDRYPSESGER